MRQSRGAGNNRQLGTRESRREMDVEGAAGHSRHANRTGSGQGVDGSQVGLKLAGGGRWREGEGSGGAGAVIGEQNRSRTLCEGDQVVAGRGTVIGDSC